MLALDAMDHSILDELLRAGRLPNTQAFIEKSQRSEVHSDGDTLHGSLWPTFASGTLPGTHGVYFWTQWIAEEMRHARNSHPALSYEPFWTYVAQAGLPVTVIDAPYVPLVELRPVRQFSGWGTHDEVEVGSWPEPFAGQFRKRFGKHPLSFDTVEPHSRADKLQMMRAMRRGVLLRCRAASRLIKEQTEGLTLIVFAETHKACHYLAMPEQLKPDLSNVDAFGRILEPFDEALPGLLEDAGPDAEVLLFSLHGVRPQADYSATIATQLLALALGKPPQEAGLRPDLVRRIRDLLPDSLHRAIWRRLPEGIRASRHGQLTTAGSDLAHDALLRLAHDGHLGIRINLAGRERDGIVAEAEGEAALARLAELAAPLRTEDGITAFDGLWRSAESAPGPRSHRLPDALLLANLAVQRVSRVSGPNGAQLSARGPEARNGVHNGRGFCFFRPGAHSAAALANSTIDNVDFAPTILELLRVSVPGHLQGTSAVR